VARVLANTDAMTNNVMNYATDQVVDQVTENRGYLFRSDSPILDISPDLTHAQRKVNRLSTNVRTRLVQEDAVGAVAFTGQLSRATIKRVEAQALRHAAGQDVAPEGVNDLYLPCHKDTGEVYLRLVVGVPFSDTAVPEGFHYVSANAPPPDVINDSPSSSVASEQEIAGAEDELPLFQAEPPSDNFCPEARSSHEGTGAPAGIDATDREGTLTPTPTGASAAVVAPGDTFEEVIAEHFVAVDKWNHNKATTWLERVREVEGELSEVRHTGAACSSQVEDPGLAPVRGLFRTRAVTLPGLPPPEEDNGVQSLVRRIEAKVLVNSEERAASSMSFYDQEGPSPPNRLERSIALSGNRTAAPRDQDRQSRPFSRMLAYAEEDNYLCALNIMFPGPPGVLISILADTADCSGNQVSMQTTRYYGRATIPQRSKFLDDHAGPWWDSSECAQQEMIVDPNTHTSQKLAKNQCAMLVFAQYFALITHRDGTANADWMEDGDSFGDAGTLFPAPRQYDMDADDEEEINPAQGEPQEDTTTPQPIHPMPLEAFGDALKATAQMQDMTFDWREERFAMHEETPSCACLAQSAIDAFNGFVRIANPAGVRDLIVYDVALPTEVFQHLRVVASSLAIEEKCPKNMLLQKVGKKLNKVMHESCDLDAKSYLDSLVHLVFMTIVLDLGSQQTSHCTVVSYSASQPKYIDYFSQNKLFDALEDLEDARIEADVEANGVVFSAPPQVIVPDNAAIGDHLQLFETEAFENYDLTVEAPHAGAITTGVDLLVRRCPINPKSPLAYVVGICRHFGNSETVVGKDTPFEIVMVLDRKHPVPMTTELKQVWEDMIVDDKETFAKVLRDPLQKFDYEFYGDGKPGSTSWQKYDDMINEQLMDESSFSYLTEDTAFSAVLWGIPKVAAAIDKHAPGARKRFQASLDARGAVKPGECSERARFVISPGRLGKEGLHQARMSPLIKALEALCAACYNHTDIKGKTEASKRVYFADFLNAVPKGAYVWGSDKSRNDACFTDELWSYVVRYLAAMAELFVDELLLQPYCYSPDEASGGPAFPDGSLQLGFWILRLQALIAVLLSGISPTGFSNRKQSKAENGATILRVLGPDAYKKWRDNEKRSVVSSHPGWEDIPDPHACDFVNRVNLVPRMVKDTNIEREKLTEDKILSHHMNALEGDDQTHVLLHPQIDGWRDLTLQEVIQKWNSIMCQVTGFIFVVAMMPTKSLMTGRNAVFEMMSAYVGMPWPKCSFAERAVIIPRPLKAMDKLSQSLVSQHHTLMKDGDNVIGVQRDSFYWALILTKHFSLAIVNKESPGIRGLFFQHGEWGYRHLVKLVGEPAAARTSVAYSARDPEKRGLEECADTTFSYCGELRDKTLAILMKVNMERCNRVAIAAWRAELPALCKESDQDITASLIAFESITITTQVSYEMLLDSSLYWEELRGIGVLLGPLMAHACRSATSLSRTFRSESFKADSAETQKLARGYLGTQAKIGKKEAKPDNHEPTQGRKTPPNPGDSGRKQFTCECGTDTYCISYNGHRQNACRKCHKSRPASPGPAKGKGKKGKGKGKGKSSSNSPARPGGKAKAKGSLRF